MTGILGEYTNEQIDKARKIKALIFDVDGVLTDGSIIYTNSGDEIKAFNVKDGQIIRHLKEGNILVGAITGRTSELVAKRCEELNLDFYYQGVKDKYSLLMRLCEEHTLGLEEIAYIGDDIIDMKIIANVGLGATPSDAMSYVQEKAHVVALAKGGEGVVREIADFILAAQYKLDNILNEYLA